MGLIIIRPDCDFPTIPHFPGPIISARTRTQALAHDQLGKLRGGLLSPAVCPGIVVATLDGDTPYRERPAIINGAHVILSNPDMLHVSILPKHPKFATLLGQLAFVVVDEAHMYRGVFGCHVATVFRRLQRLCHFYGGRPQYVGCSATIANGAVHFGRLVPALPPPQQSRGLAGGAATAAGGAAAPPQPPSMMPAIRVISRDGSPSGEKLFGIWNPPLLDESLQKQWTPEQMPGAAVRRVSSISEAANVLALLVQHGLRTIAFVPTPLLHDSAHTSE
jgi:DEAD/DEAH box helicase domain-containing protein